MKCHTKKSEKEKNEQVCMNNHTQNRDFSRKQVILYDKSHKNDKFKQLTQFLYEISYKSPLQWPIDDDTTTCKSEPTFCNMIIASREKVFNKNAKERVCEGGQIIMKTVNDHYSKIILTGILIVLTIIAFNQKTSKMRSTPGRKCEPI